LAFTIALNAVSSHALCTVAFGAIAFFIIATLASIETLKDVGWIAYVGFVSIMAAILTVVIAVTQRDRPAAAPQTGTYDLGFQAGPATGTSFAMAWVAALAIFSSSANTPAFVSSLSSLVDSSLHLPGPSDRCDEKARGLLQEHICLYGIH